MRGSCRAIGPGAGRPIRTGGWRLYLVTSETASKGAAAAYKVVQKTMMTLQARWLDPLEITLTNPSDPRVTAIRDFQKKHPAPLATNVRNQYLGKVYFDGAYIYPPQPTS